MTAPVRDLLGAGTLLRTGPGGDITDPAAHGLFVDDTRHLSRWELTVDGAAPVPLGGGVLMPRTGRGTDPPYTITRHQAVHDGGFTERLDVRNHRAEPVTLTLELTCAADFADMFELRTDRAYTKPAAERTPFSYTRGDFHRRTDVRGELRQELHLAPHAGATVELRVTARAGRTGPPPAITARPTGAVLLDAALTRGCADLTALLMPSPAAAEDWVVAAGSPWFLTLFGRDSLLTAAFALDAAPWLAAATLRALAAVQGTVLDPARAEEPGKILHERRLGELSHFGQVPYGRYYGTVDATPLFLMLLAATRDDALARELEPAARAAVRWMFVHGGLDRTGWLVYRTDGPGLVHQCWKDSARGICHRSGEPALGELAVSEVQGYAYAALLGTAELARRVWHDGGYADRLEAAADDLRARFARDFWLADDDFVAVALADGRQVDALASNAGHVLWTGILHEDRGRRAGRRLAAPDFFNGWGIRTVAAGQPAYHPVSYHTGGVWPHDTAIAVAGLARYGLTAEAHRVAGGLLAAAAAAGGRLPEVMAGFGRDEHDVPVPYPHSCSPQAWAAAAPLLLRSALY